MTSLTIPQVRGLMQIASVDAASFKTVTGICQNVVEHEDGPHVFLTKTRTIRGKPVAQPIVEMRWDEYISQWVPVTHEVKI